VFGKGLKVTTIKEGSLQQSKYLILGDKKLQREGQVRFFGSPRLVQRRARKKHTRNRAFLVVVQRRAENEINIRSLEREVTRYWRHISVKGLYHGHSTCQLKIYIRIIML